MGLATITSNLQIQSGKLSYQSNPTNFQAVVNGSKGPVPGAFTAQMGGTDVDFSQLTQPGLCRIMNLDQLNAVEYGIWDQFDQEFYSLGEILPGETYVIRLSRFLGLELGPASGTGSVGRGTRLRVKAIGAPCDVIVEAFEA